MPTLAKSQKKLNLTFGSVLRYGIFALGLLVGFVLLAMSDVLHVFDEMFILPMVYSLIVLASKPLFENIGSHIARMILVGGITIRNVVTPFFIAVGGFEVVTMGSVERSGIVSSVLLMLFESAVLFAVMNLYAYKADQNTEENTKKNVQKTFRDSTLFTPVVIFITIIMIVCLIAVPSITDSYKNLWTVEDNVIITTFSSIRKYNAGSASRLMYAFFLMFFSVMQIVWSIGLIRIVRKLCGEKFIGILLSYGVVFLNTLFVSETSAYTVFVLVILVLFIMMEFPSKKRTVFIVAVLGCAAVLLKMILVRVDTYSSDEGSALTQFATFFNSYFPGVVNNSVMKRVSVPSKGVSLYMDVYSSIPLQSLIKPLVMGKRLSDYFNIAFGSEIEILPLVSQTYFYFGVFGVLIQAAIVLFALRWERKAAETDNFIKYVAYVTGAVIFSAGCTMYDLTIILSFLFKTILPFLIFGACTNVKLSFRR